MIRRAKFELATLRFTLKNKHLLPLALFFFTFFGGTITFAQIDLVRARQALGAGQTAEAIRLLEQYRGSGTSDPEVYNLLGIAYGRAGNNDRALTMFQEFARLAPKRPQAFNNLGAAYLQHGNSEQAEIAFRRALRLDPADIGAMYNLGALLNSQHKYSASQPILERAISRERSPAIAYELAVAFAGNGDRKRSLALLNSMSAPPGESAVSWFRLTGTLNLDEGNREAASRALERATALDPADIASLSALALVRVRENQPELAIALLEKAYTFLPPDQRATRIGSILTAFGAYPQALEVFEQATANDPSSYDALYNIAILKLDKIKDLRGALAAAEAARKAKDSGEIHNLLGDIREAQGQYLDAIHDYQEAVQLDPEIDKFAFDLGAELILHENNSAALTVFEAAATRFPKSARIYLGLGTANFINGRNDESVTAFLKAVDLNPSFEPAYLFLGEAFTFSGARAAEVAGKLATLAARAHQNFSAQYYYAVVLIHQLDEEDNVANIAPAKAALQRASLLKPQDARTSYQWGELYRLQKRLPESIPYYSKAINLDPDLPEPLYKLGQVYTRLGKPGDAKNMFARHKEVLARSEASLYKRSSEIQSFVLKMRSIE